MSSADTDDDSIEARLPALIQRVRRLGTDTATIEIKSSVGRLPKTTGETLSAFGNGSGGTLILGLDERQNFQAAPGFNANAIRDALAGLCSNDMEPPVRGDIEICHFEDAQAVVLEVAPLDPPQRPLHIRARGAYGGSFIRSGDGDRRLTHYEVTQLLSNRRQPADDSEIVLDASLEDLDPERIKDHLDRLRARSNRAFANVTDETALIRSGAAKRTDEGWVRPTVAGLMCLGIFPQQFFPQLFVSFVALPGPSLGSSLEDGTRFLDNVTCDGPIPDMLSTVLQAAQRNMRTAAVIQGGGRRDRHDYPLEVIRELVVNALLHRDYSPMSRGTQVQVEMYPDRLVVKSPGGLYGNVVPSQLGIEEISSTRNPTLAKLLADVPDGKGLPVSENRGSGLSRVMARLQEAGMSPPDFDTQPGHVHVTVPHHALLDPPTVEWIASIAPGKLNDEQHIALALMRARGSVSNEMLRAWGVESHAATNALRGLVDLHLAVKRGGRRYATYDLVDDTENRLPIDVPLPEGSRLRPSPGRQQRIETELLAVLEAIKSGHKTVRAVQQRLGLSYPTANRRVNTLLHQGRILETAPAHSRARTFKVSSPGA